MTRSNRRANYNHFIYLRKGKMKMKLPIDLFKIKPHPFALCPIILSYVFHPAFPSSGFNRLSFHLITPPVFGEYYTLPKGDFFVFYS